MGNAAKVDITVEFTAPPPAASRSLSSRDAHHFLLASPPRMRAARASHAHDRFQARDSTDRAIGMATQEWSAATTMDEWFAT
jgi:hypothetical protein